MPKTAPEQIKTRLLQGYDPEYFSSLYRLMNYASGEPWNNKRLPGSAIVQEGDFPDFPDIVAKYQKVGTSMRIRNAQFIALSKVMYGDPEPEVLGVDKFTAEILKQGFLDRYHRGEWQNEMAAAFLDGDGLGLGFVQIGLKTNPDSGLQYTTIRHSPAINTIYDRHERSPSRARWIAFVTYLPRDIAADLYGEKVARENVYNYFDSYNSHSLEVVRMIDYWDMGVGLKGRPTHAVIPRNLTNKPLLIEDNDFGILPFAHYEHAIFPGWRRPIGRIIQQMAAQEMLNRIERKMKNTLESGAVDLIDAKQVNADDVRRYNGGDENAKIRYETPIPGVKPWDRIPAQEMPSFLPQLVDMWERQITVDSGITDFDKGIQPEHSRTLGENQLVDARSQAQGSWSEKQSVLCFERLAHNVFKIAKQFDRDPMSLDVFGAQVPINNPAEPLSAWSNFIPDNLKIQVGSENLRKQSQQVENQAKMQQLQGSLPLVQMGLIDPVKFTEEWVSCIDQAGDPKDWMPQGGQMQAMQGQMPPEQPGMQPGQPQQPAA